MNEHDFVIVPRCTVVYSGPTFAHRAGERCDGVKGHEDLPATHTLHSRRHFSGEGHNRISWFTPAQKEAGLKGE